MTVKADPGLTLTFDASCSTDPDLSPEEFGPSEQGLSYTFECYRPCESQPVHNASDPLWSFVDWDNKTNPYCTSCVENGTSLEGCFVPYNFHVAGPLSFYNQSEWESSETYPLSVDSSVDNINKVCIS